MTTANGHANGQQPKLSDLQEQLRIVRTQKAIRKHQAELKLLESFSASYTGLNWGDLVDPFDAYRDADNLRAFPIGARDDRRDGRNRPFVWSDLDLDFIRGQARWLTTRNEFAIGALGNLRNYTIKKGYTYEAKPAKGFAKDAVATELARQVQEVSDDYGDINLMPKRERSSFWRSRRDGDLFWRHFAQEDGTTLVRFIEAEQVRQPLGSPNSWLFGIHTDEQDIENVISYAVSYYDPDDWEDVPAGDVCHLKLNVDECVKRGISDFFCTADAFDEVRKLLRNMRITGGVQAAIAWIEQFETATASSVQAQVQAARDQNRTYYPQAVTGKEVNYQRFDPGNVVKVGKGRNYLNAPLANNTTQHIGIVQAALRALGVRWCMPEYMISGDASNGNFASILVAGSPFVNAIECEQDDYAIFFLRSRWIAIRNAAHAGRFVVNDRRFTFEEVQKYVDIHVTPPQVAIVNKAEESTIDHQDLADGVTSIQQIQAKRGYDTAKIAQDRREQPPPPPGGQAGGAPPAGPPAAAGPPGFFPRLARPN